jgi:acyl carrier protein
MGDLRARLRRGLVARFGVRDGVDDDTGLFSGGLIDSLSVIELISFVEAEIGLSIPPADITLENFDSINRIVRLAEALTAAEGKK